MTVSLEVSIVRLKLKRRRVLPEAEIDGVSGRRGKRRRSSRN